MARQNSNADSVTRSLETGNYAYGLPNQVYSVPISNGSHIPTAPSSTLSESMEEDLGPYSCAGFSKSRLRFLLFIIFDLIFVALLWSIFVVGGLTTHGQRTDSATEDAFANQIFLSPADMLAYSLFDLVILSIFRFIWLVLLFALFRLNHWWPAGVTVLVTSVFVLVKVLRFKFEGNAIEYALIICSFVIAWIELWLVDFRVLPGERKDKARLLAAVPVDRRALVSHDYLQAQSDADVEYLSAMEPNSSPEISSDDDEQQNGAVATRTSRKLFGTKGKGRPKPGVDYGSGLQLSSQDYINRAQEGMRQARLLHAQSESWKQPSGGPSDSVVLSHHDDTYGRLFLTKAVLDAPIQLVFDVLHTHVDLWPQWNKQIEKMQVLLKVNAFVDVVYSISGPSAGGWISARDFLDVRSFTVEDGCYFISAVSVQSNVMPPRPRLVRGENGPNLYVLKPTDDGRQCTFHWLMNTNLKGGLPRGVVDRSLTTFLHQYVKCLNEYLKDVRTRSNL